MVVHLPKNSNFVIKRNGHCLYSEYKRKGQTNKRDSYCASYCLYIIYFTGVVGIDFESACFEFILSNGLKTLMFSLK